MRIRLKRYPFTFRLLALMSPLVTFQASAAQITASAPPSTAIESLHLVGTLIGESSALAAPGTSAGLYDVFRPAGPQSARLAKQIDSLLARAAAYQQAAGNLSSAEGALVNVDFSDPAFAEILRSASKYSQYLKAGVSAQPPPEIQSTVRKARLRLMDNPVGLGIEGAALMPVALAMEAGSAYHTGAKPSEIRLLFRTYARWIDRMRSESNGSIPFARRRAEMSHDRLLAGASQSHLGKRLGVSNLLLAGNQEPIRIADPCVLINSNSVAWDLDARGAVVPPADTHPLITPQFTKNLMVGKTSIQLTNDISGARLVLFFHDPGADHPAPYYFARPPLGNYCYIGRSQSVLSTEAAFAAANNLPGVKEDEEARARIRAAIDNANAARLTIALSADALEVTRELEEMMGFLERTDVQ